MNKSISLSLLFVSVLLLLKTMFDFASGCGICTLLIQYSSMFLARSLRSGLLLLMTWTETIFSGICSIGVSLVMYDKAFPAQRLSK